MPVHYCLLILALLLTGRSSAQLVVGSEGMTVMPTIPINVDGLSLIPSSTLTITDNQIQRSSNPVAGTPNASISRVYQFSVSIPFSGTAGIYYLPSELNGNSEPNLQLACQPAMGAPYNITTGSTVDQTTHYVSNAGINQNLYMITATSQNSALPVTLINFAASTSNQTVRLRWITSLERNADFFDIQHSLDVESWQTIGRLQAKGESVTNADYEFIHTAVSRGANYYRLKMVDKDATYSYSPTRAVVIDVSDKLLLFPNPVGHWLNLKGDALRKLHIIRIYAESGQLVKEIRTLPVTGIDVTDLASGKYVLRVEGQDGRQSSHAFIKEQ